VDAGVAPDGGKVARYSARSPNGCSGASGVMATVMLQQQGAMREVLAWESEVEGAMREMARRVEEDDL